MVGINTNVTALSAQRSLSQSSSMVAKSIHRLSTGLRINSAADDAAGLAISKRMDAQSAGLGAAERNANDGISLLQTAEGALQETSTILIRMKELATQSANATNSATDRKAIESEVNQLKDEINRIAETSNFNGINLLDNSFSSQSFQIGVTASETIDVSIGGARGEDLGNNRIASVNATTSQGAGAASAAATANAGNTIEAQDLTLSGSLGTNVTTITNGQSAYDIASAVNDTTGSHGVIASATSTAKLSGLDTSSSISFTLSSSGGSSTLVTASVDTDDLSNLVDEVNRKTGTTGISASIGDDNGELVLTQANGKDIIIDDFSSDDAGAVTATLKAGTAAGGFSTGVTLTSAATAGAGTDSTTVSGVVFFDSSESFTAQSSITAASGSILASDATFTSSEELLDSVTVTTAESSQTAMRIIDSALTSINSLRADLGSTQNRFNSTISNIKTANENIQAASSQIKDADYATETTQLAKSQILQQAATAMLAQANQAPQSVLSLIQ